MKNEKIATLGQLLRNAQHVSWTSSLYLPYGAAWKLDTPCMIVDAEVSAGQTTLCGEIGFECALGLHQVQAIFRNASAQRVAIADEELLEAFLYWYDNDAFLDFDAKREDK